MELAFSLWANVYLFPYSKPTFGLRIVSPQILAKISDKVFYGFDCFCSKNIYCACSIFVKYSCSHLYYISAVLMLYFRFGPRESTNESENGIVQHCADEATNRKLASFGSVASLILLCIVA